MKMQRQGSSSQQNSTTAPSDAATSKKKRNRPGNPRPDAEVVALSPRTLLATNRFVCEVCHKGFQRDQNLQLHLRGHNMPWKLKQRNPKEARRRVYLCPEPTCVHHNPARALGDLTGIKKHYCRKHGEKHLKCDKCNKRYAVESDWKAHCKTCGTREYRCECHTLFSRKDSFVAHRATCDAAIRVFRETAQLPPLGAGLYAGSGSVSDIVLGLASTGVAKMHDFADQGQSSSAAEATQSQFDHAMPSYPGAFMFRSQPSSFFLGGRSLPSDQDMSEDGGDHSAGSQGHLRHGKAPFDGLMHQLPEQQYQPSSSNANFTLMDLAFFYSNNGGESSSQGPLPHGKEPFHGNDLMQMQQHQPGSSNVHVNLPNQLATVPNLGVFSGNSGASWSGASSSNQNARFLIQDQFNGGAGGSNTKHGNVMASIGSHFSSGFTSMYNSSPSPSAGYNSSPSPSATISATALLMKAAQMGSTTSTTSSGPSALLHVAGFTGSTTSGQGTTSRTAEEEASHEAHFHDLIMNSPPLMGGTGTVGGFSGTAGFAGVDNGSLSTRDFLGGGRGDGMAPQGHHMGALDPNQMKWFM